jgi:hypothetical protein
MLVEIKVILSGIEPETYCLEGSCSIQLSYRTLLIVRQYCKGKSVLKLIHPINMSKSGWQDSNLRPPAPKAGAITGLRYTPYSKNLFRFW